MSEQRDLAVEEFAEAADLDRRLLRVVAQVLSKSPRAVIVAWEEADGVIKATSVPFSFSLIKGMVDTLFDMTFGEQGRQDEDDDESVQ